MWVCGSRGHESALPSFIPAQAGEGCGEASGRDCVLFVQVSEGLASLSIYYGVSHDRFVFG